MKLDQRNPILRTIFALCFSLPVLACSGGDGEGNPVDPDVSDFTLDQDVQDEIDDAAANGDGAEGTFDYNEEEGTLTFNIATSSFGCGIETGELVATVLSVNATTLVLRFGDDDGQVTWTRLDEIDPSESNPVVGVWHTEEPSIYLLLSSDGGLQLISNDDFGCDSGDRERNEENCLSLDVPGGSNITIDGDLSDWTQVRSGAILEDDSGDSSVEGGDLRSMQVAFSVNKLYVRMELNGPPSENFQARQDPNGGEYRLTVRGDNGLSISTRAAYSPESQTWAQVSPQEGIEVGVDSAGIEWSVDVSNYQGEGFNQIDLIMIEPLDCGQGSCERVDEMDCGWMEVPAN